MNPEELLRMITDLVTNRGRGQEPQARSPGAFEFAPGSEPSGFGPQLAPEAAPEPRQSQTSLERHMGDVFSGTTVDLGKRFGYSDLSELESYMPIFNRMAGETGDSAAFQRQLYRQMTGREAPQNYTGFGASQADRITNVFSPDEVDINAMQEIAFIASAMREMMNAGYASVDDLRGTQTYRDTWNQSPSAPSQSPAPRRRGLLPGSILGPGY
jgi:hypothetical protein